MGYVIPPVNDIDVYGQDLGFIAVVENGNLAGFNVCVGGGMGQLDSREDSYPRLAENVGFVSPEAAPEFAEIVMGIQRDYGDRKDRHRARFKYTLDRLGTQWFLDELRERRGKVLQPARPVTFERNGDSFGWQEGSDGHWYATLYIESGRIQGPVQSQLRGLLESFGGRVRLTANQNLQLTHIGHYELAQVKWRLQDLGLAARLAPELQAAHTISCVSLPTCGLAMAEAERYTPAFLQRFNRLKARHGLDQLPITLRISGCPNGCARPYLAEIALTGRAPGLYNLYLGGSFHGDRLAQRHPTEHFGDFLVRSNLLRQARV